jgi:hypothetical protein
MSEDMQLKWKVTAMDCYPEFSGATDYVFNVHWDCLSYYNGVSGGPYYGRVYSVTSIPAYSGTVTPYLDLQENQVFDWVYSVFQSGDKERFENSSIQQIVNQIAPPVVTPPSPWPADIFPVIAPSITIQPQSQMTLWSGQNTFISLMAAGQPLYYQWRKDSNNLPEATGAGLSIQDIQLDQAGLYDVIVSNSLGSVASSGCVISVSPPSLPVINDQPKGGSVDYSGSFAMSVGATGYPSPSYQWSLNGIEISEAKNYSYFINDAELSQAGDYMVKVYNAAGEVTSNVAHVDVIIPI